MSDAKKTDDGAGGTPRVSDSFDPSTWKLSADPASTSLPPAPRPGVDRRLWLVGGAAGLIIAGGAAKLMLTRRPGAAPHGDIEQQLMTLPVVSALPSALVSFGFDATTSAAIGEAAAKALPSGRSDGLRLELKFIRRGQTLDLVSLTLTRNDGSGVAVGPAASGFVGKTLAVATSRQFKVAHGQIDAQSFYSSAVAAGLSDALIPDFFQAFVYDFDFQREIAPGDVFEAAFEQMVNDRGEAVGARELLYAAMTTKAKSRALYRFKEVGQTEANWFDGAGKNIRRSLMRTPVEGARISSTFGMRDHPVLGFTRMHKGTDFATPVGTPVYASGAGKITFMGLHGGHGNYIAVEHTPSLSTAYAHLSAYGPGLQVGSMVNQGQQIALSGNTGLSSGPHLHYEVIVNGEQVDSQSFQTEEGHALAGADLTAFFKERDRIDVARTGAL